jgi:hypothetical protein
VITDRELLRAAWPDGYLPMRGVLTVGGWTCVEVVNGEARFALPHQGLAERVLAYANAPDSTDSLSRALIERGDLLPAVALADAATWACLLADLADASNGYWASFRREDLMLLPKGGLTFTFDGQNARLYDSIANQAWWVHVDNLRAGYADVDFSRARALTGPLATEHALVAVRARLRALRSPAKPPP